MPHIGALCASLFHAGVPCAMLYCTDCYGLLPAGMAHDQRAGQGRRAPNTYMCLMRARCAHLAARPRASVRAHARTCIRVRCAHRAHRGRYAAAGPLCGPEAAQHIYMCCAWPFPSSTGVRAPSSLLTMLMMYCPCSMGVMTMYPAHPAQPLLYT